ncbi:MAG: porin family protein [Bacteroidota bacterium]
MKRILLFISVIHLFVTLDAQVRFSISANPQLNWFSSDLVQIVPSGAGAGISTGLDIDYFFAPNYAFTTGFNINWCGAKLTYTQTAGFPGGNDTLFTPAGAIMTHRMQFVTIPIGLKLKSEELGYTTFYFHGGFTPMIRLNAFTSSYDETVVKEYVKESFRGFNLGYFIAGGIEYRLAGNTALRAGLRWSSTLTDLTAFDDANIKLNGMALDIGILF